MKFSLAYEFETLEKLLNDIVPTEQLTTETSRITRAWRSAIPGNTAEMLGPYFQLHFDRLGELMSKGNMDTLWPLFTELTTRHRRYIDPKSPWPAAGIPIIQQRGRETLNRLRGLPASARIDGKLLVVLDNQAIRHAFHERGNG